MTPAYLAPLAKPGAHYTARAGQVHVVGNDRVPDFDRTVLALADIAVSSRSDDLAELTVAQFADFIRASREAARQSQTEERKAAA